MNTKLTLRLDDHLIKSAKEYSDNTGKSLSRIVTDLFVIIEKEKLKKTVKTTPVVQSLKGVIKNGSFSDNDYKKHLEDKYL